MRYLSKYKLFENLEETKKTIEEICYDITDEGFEILIRPTTFSKNHTILEIKNKKRFKFTEIEDVIYRIKDFLGKRITQSSFKEKSSYTHSICDVNYIKKEIVNEYIVGKIYEFDIIFTND